MGARASVDQGVGRLVLSNPPLNILTRSVLGSLRDELRRMASDSSLRVLLLSAEGKHFSAGAAVEEHLPPEFTTLIPEFLDTVAEIDAFPLPVIAVVQGRCLGGGFELVLAADIVIAAEGASFGQPEILLGVLPPAACALLPDLCPRGVAAELVFTGEALSAPEAERFGLVRRVVPDAELEQAAVEMAQRIARHSAAALRVAKPMLHGGQRSDRMHALARAGQMYTEDLMRTEDAVAGLEAFLAKRQPTWRHR